MNATKKMLVPIGTHNTLTPPPPGNLRIVDRRLYPGGGEFEPCLGGVRHLNRGWKVFPAKYLCLKRYRVRFRDRMA